MNARTLGLLTLVLLLTWALWVLLRPSGRVPPTENVSVIQPAPTAAIGESVSAVAPPPSTASAAMPADERILAQLAVPQDEAPVATPAALTASIVGRLVDPDGDPILRGQVAVIDGVGGGYRAKVKGNAFRVEGLAAGTYWVLGTADEFHTGRERVELFGANEISVDLVLERRIGLLVRLLTTDEQPHPVLSMAPEDTTFVASSLEILVTKEPPPEWLPEPRAIESAGAFQRSIDPQLGTLGYVELEGEPPVWTSLLFKETLLATQAVHEGNTEVTFRLSGDGIEAKLSTVRIRVTHAITGKPVGFATCVLSRESWSTVAYQDVQETAELSGLAPGPYTLQVFGEGLWCDLESVFAEAGEVVEISCELGGAGRIAGRLVDPSGKPLRGIGPDTAVFIGDLSIHARPVAWDVPLHHRIDEQGGFSIAGNRGLYVMRVIGSAGISANVVVDTTKGPVDDLEIVLREPVSVSLRLAVGSRSWRDCLCFIRDENGVEAAAGWLDDPHEELLVVPGTYHLVVTNSYGEPLFESPTFLVDKEPVELEVRL